MKQFVFHVVVLLAGWSMLFISSGIAQDVRPPEGAIVTGTPAPESGAWTEKFLKHSDGVWFRYHELGKQGPPVVLLHGLGSTGYANWIAPGIAGALAETNRVYVPDMRYAGRPAGSPAFPTQSGMNNNSNAADVLFFMDALKIDKAHVGGYSMGGGTTAMLMQRAPERFITAHFGGSGPRETAEFIDKVIPDPRPPADAGGAARRGRGAPPAGGSASAGGATAPPANTAAATPAGSNSAAPPAAGDAGRGRGSAGGLYPGGGPPTTYAGDLKAIKFPVISIIGEFDAPNYVTHRLYRELDDYHRVVLPGRQHMTSVRDPKYTEALRGFIIANNPK